MAWLWDVPTITSKDTAEGVLLLADLAEASASLSLQTSRQGEILTFLTPEQVRAVESQQPLAIVVRQHPWAEWFPF
jgi:aminoglycoside/choline kinase family phosphotransferase